MVWPSRSTMEFRRLHAGCEAEDLMIEGEGLLHVGYCQHRAYLLRYGCVWHWLSPRRDDWKFSSGGADFDDAGAEFFYLFVAQAVNGF
jgi:hypothetical protein